VIPELIEDNSLCPRDFEGQSISKENLNAIDDNQDLPSRIELEEDSYKSEMAEWDFLCSETQPSHTPTINISYSLGEEIEIVKQWADTTNGPPGFHNFGDW
jgi:hypothetical protein